MVERWRYATLNAALNLLVPNSIACLHLLAISNKMLQALAEAVLITP